VVLIKRPSRILPSEITGREMYRRRREFMVAAAAMAGGAILPEARAQAPKLAFKPSTYSTTEKQNTLKEITSYNNFYEFGTEKEDPGKNAGKLRTRPWTITVKGEVKKPKTYAIEDLLKFPLEERVYRLRCVEAWSMVIPWIGFELNRIIRDVEPTSRAKFVEFVSAMQPDTMPGLRMPFLDWPYNEGLRMDEASHPLTILAVGLYGDLLPNPDGAPVRLVVPWKYGFKSAKSIVEIRFVESQPKITWEKAGPNEYGFYSNVNPDVDHPRWSQRRERRLPAFFANRTTELFNGYADQVASLYTGMDLRRYF
jgi:sulfoxide reductase catalytic subunit YedY